MLLSFLSSTNAFRSYLIIFKCALAMWLRSLTAEISYVSCTGEVVSQILETVLCFLECIVAKSFVNVNIFEKNFKFAMLIKLYVPINPLGPIVHGLYFLSDNVFSIRCIYVIHRLGGSY